MFIMHKPNVNCLRAKDVKVSVYIKVTKVKREN